MTENEKLERFSKAVFKEADDKINEILTEAQNISNEKILNASDKYLVVAEKNINDETKKIHSKYVRLVATEKLNAHKDVLSHRQEIISKVFENVKAKIKAFTSSEKYEQYLVSLAQKAYAENNELIGEVRLAGRDMKFSKALLNVLPVGFIVVEDKSIKLGGLKLSYPEINLLNDCTIDSAVEAERENFSLNPELRLDENQ